MNFPVQFGMGYGITNQHGKVPEEEVRIILQLRLSQDSIVRMKHKQNRF